jgi:hypothetical protein
MYCTSCHAPLEAAASFCVQCGNPTSPIPAQPGGKQGDGSHAVLGTDTETGTPITLTQNARIQGLYTIGKQGTGKTSFLLNLMLQDAEVGTGFCFIDPHGDATQDLLRRLPKETLSKVMLLDVADTQHPFGLNFYEVEDLADKDEIDRRAGEAVGVFKKLWGEGEGASWGPRLEDLLRIISYTLIENPPSTLAEVDLLLTNSAFRADAVSRLTNEVARSFWETEYDPEQEREQREHRASTVNKVRSFLLNRTIRRIVGQSHTTIDFRACMDEGAIVLVNLALGNVGEDVVNLLGSVMVGMIANAAFSRVDTDDRPPFHLYADEYQRFATPAFARLLTEARKYNLATTTAHQNRSQLKIQGAAVSTIAAANIVVFGVSGEDGRELAVEFDRTPPPAPVSKEHLKQDVVGHLLREGHSDPRVGAFTSRYLQHLDAATRQTITRDPRTFRDIYPELSWGVDVYPYDPSVVREGLLWLNKYFHAVAQGLVKPSDMPALLFITTGSYLGFDTIFGAKWVNEEQVPLSQYLVAALWRAASGGSQKMMPDLPEADYVDILRDVVQRRNKIDRFSIYLPEEKAEAFVQREFQRALAFYTALLAATEGLATEPIVTDSGIAHQQIVQRSFTDKEEEIANMLAHLPKRTARVKVGTTDGFEEHTIETLALPASLNREAYRDRVEEIRHRNLRAGVLRERDEVEEEITLRQSKWRPAPPPIEPSVDIEEDDRPARRGTE